VKAVILSAPDADHFVAVLQCERTALTCLHRSWTAASEPVFAITVLLQTIVLSEPRLTAATTCSPPLCRRGAHPAGRRADNLSASEGGTICCPHCMDFCILPGTSDCCSVILAWCQSVHYAVKVERVGRMCEQQVRLVLSSHCRPIND
jgi:hypothetical protein